MNEYLQKSKNDYENFMDPEVVQKYVDQNRECTLFVSKIGKRIWKPDGHFSKINPIYK